MSSHQTPHAICISEWAVCCWYGKTQGDCPERSKPSAFLTLIRYAFLDPIRGMIIFPVDSLCNGTDLE